MVLVSIEKDIMKSIHNQIKSSFSYHILFSFIFCNSPSISTFFYKQTVRNFSTDSCFVFSATLSSEYQSIKLQ